MYPKIQQRQVITDVLHPSCARPPRWSPPVLWRRRFDNVADAVVMCRDVVGSDTVLSSDEELETESSAVEHGNVALTGAGSALHCKDKCRKTLKLSSEQLVSCFAIPRYTNVAFASLRHSLCCLLYKQQQQRPLYRSTFVSRHLQLIMSKTHLFHML